MPLAASTTASQPYQAVKQVAFDFWAKPVLQRSDGLYYCPGFDGETYASNPFDRMFVAIPFNPPLEQPFTPGICRVNAKKFRDVDKKKAAGADGARITIHGVEPAEVEIQILIWTPEQLRRLKDLWSVVAPAPGKGSPLSYEVQHPTLDFYKIRALQFVQCEGPAIDDRQRGIYTIKAWEFLKPGKKNTTKTEVGAIGSINDPTPDKWPTPGSSSSNTDP